MAALQGYLSGHEATLEELPPWKRELIMRKRASARIHGGIGMPQQPQTLMAARPGRSSMSGRPPLSSPPGPPAGTLSSPPGPPPSAGTGFSLSGPGATRSLSGPPGPSPPPAPPTGLGNTRNWATSSRLVGASASTRDGGEGNRGYDASLPVTSDNNYTSSNMHHKGLCDEGSRVTSPTSSTFSDSYNNYTVDEQGGDPDEELSYGPGIVSKLKNRYMSLAMREQRGRPALRRCSSLEDLLDDDPVEIRDHKERAAARDSAAQYRLDRMKRARSVDSLSTRHRPEEGPYRGPPGRRPMPKSRSATSNLESSLMALGKDDVIIIETSKGVPAAAAVPQQQGQKKPFKDSRSSVNGGSPRHTEVLQPDHVPLPPLQRKLSSSSLAEEEELPPPDTVRSVRQVFEGGSNSSSHVSSSKPLRGTAARVQQHKTSKPNGLQSSTKPALAIKPAVVPSHRKATPPLTPVSPPVTSNMPFSIEDAKKRLKHVAAVTRPSPRGTMGVKPTQPDLNGEMKVQEPKPLSPRPGLTPITKSHTAPTGATTITNGNQSSSPPIGRPAHPAHDTDSEDEEEEGFRKVSNAAISNIRKDAGLSQEFNFANKGSSSPVVGRVKPSSPTPAALPSSPIASHKVVTSPTLSENQRVEQENRKNVEKSRSKVEPVKVNLSKVESGGVYGGSKVNNSSGSGSPHVVLGSSSPPVQSGSSSPGTEELVEAVNKKPLKTSPSKAWHQQQSNTQTFNFTTKKDPVPEHLENDGLDMSIRRPKVRQISTDSGYVIMPGFFEGRQDSSTDGDDPEDPGADYLDSRPGVPPAPCGINFQGEAVIINGRSNLQRQPRNKRLNISFDDSLTQTFEYPSESSFLEEDSEGGPVSPSSGDTPGTGGLASYTPSKIQLDSDFQLGVSRTTPINPPASAPGPPAVTERSEEEEEYLRPADESETVMWSSGSTSDMLF